jgi:ubiquinone/menaquinone biosynthesis C-methylase UbiE
LDDPFKQAKAKAAAAYDAASDHFDDAPMSFWDRIGRRTVEGLALPSDGNVLDVGCGTGAWRCQPRELSDRTASLSVSIWPRDCSIVLATRQRDSGCRTSSSGART